MENGHCVELCKQMTIELIVHFIRSDAENDDDCIRICKASPNFRVHSNLLMNDSEADRLRTVSIMSHHAVVRFVQDVFALVALDSIPFEAVQVSSPLAPAVSFDVKPGCFDKARETLVRLVDTTLSHWPDAEPHASEGSVKRRRTE